MNISYKIALNWMLRNIIGGMSTPIAVELNVV